MIRKPSPLQWYIILIVIAAILALALPPNKATIHMLNISVAEYRAAVVTLLLPYGVIWFSAFYAYDKLRNYAEHLLSTREGRAYKKVANGLGILAWGLAVPTILELIFNAIASAHPNLKVIYAMTNNYLALLVPLAAFVLIGNGTRKLSELVKGRPTLSGMRIFAVIFILLGVVFTYTLLHSQPNNSGPYYLSTYPLIATIIMPYLFMWFVGFMSAYELILYSQRAKGLLYKQALTQLAGGIVIVIVCSISAQYITILYAGRNTASFTTLLIVIYGLLIVEVAGFALIALGAKRLKKIEEV